MTDVTGPAGMPAKKGLSPLAWIAIGCGALVLVGIVAAIGVAGYGAFKLKQVAEDFEDNPARATAELMVKVNPDLELVSTDDEAGEMTVRNTKTGEVATMSFDEIADGKFTMRTEEGEYTVDLSSQEGGGSMTVTTPEGQARYGVDASLESVPDWVPLYPDASSHQGTYNFAGPDGLTGAVSSSTSDPPAEVVEHYENLFEDGGWTVKGQTSATTQDGSHASISGERGGQTLNIMATGGEDETQVVVTYQEKKD